MNSLCPKVRRLGELHVDGEDKRLFRVGSQSPVCKHHGARRGEGHVPTED